MRRLLAALALAVACGRPDGIDAAQRILLDDGAWETTTKAGESFAEVSETLNRAGRRCRNERPARQPCDAMLSAAAWAQVAAFRMESCTQTRIGTARLELRRHLKTLEGREASGLPALPQC